MSRIILFALLSAFTLRAAEPQAYTVPPQPAWLSQITRIEYTDLPNCIPQHEWPDKFIPAVAAAGAQMLFSRVHSGSDWDGLGWRSEFGKPDSRMGDKDGTREVIELCKKYKLRYAAYYYSQKEPASLASEHPEWLCLDQAGKRVPFFCNNQPGYRALVRNRIVELVAKYGADAIYFDMFFARTDQCYCPACSQKFKALSGQEPPRKEDFSDLWQQWVSFKYRSIEEALLDYNRAIKAANPEAALLANTWNSWLYRHPSNARNSIRVSEVVDGMLAETGWYDSADPSFFAFPVLHNFMSWHLGGLARNHRAFMWNKSAYSTSRLIESPELLTRVFTSIANGAMATPSVPSLATFQEAMHALSEREPYLVESSLYPWCGLVVSEKTELWYRREDVKARYLKGIYGAFQTMMTRHLPVVLVTDRDLELGRLPDCKVLFLPNCAAMSPPEVETVRRFVSNGGGLVATYETSFHDGRAHPLKEPGLKNLLGFSKHADYDALVPSYTKLQYDPREDPHGSSPLPHQSPLVFRCRNQPLFEQHARHATPWDQKQHAAADRPDVAG